jgi:nucleotide-binding universal stress UspA family protein
MSPRRHGLRDAPAVIVGVDGSESNAAAVDYAVLEAVQTNRALVLLGVLEDPGFRAQARPHPESEREWEVLTRITVAAVRDHPRLRVRRVVDFGKPVDVLLEHAKIAHSVVVGKRGLGTFGRLMLGSTSTSVAGHAQVPVVVVPTGWRRVAHQDRRVAVGVELKDPRSTALRFAFEEAERRGVGLDVVHAIDVEPALVWEPVLNAPTYRHLDSRDQTPLEETVAPLRAEFPSVPARLFDVRGNAASVLLERSHEAQLLVLGRHHNGAFGLGCTARAVLHYAEIPVAVIPS